MSSQLGDEALELTDSLGLPLSEERKGMSSSYLLYGEPYSEDRANSAIFRLTATPPKATGEVYLHVDWTLDSISLSSVFEHIPVHNRTGPNSSLSYWLPGPKTIDLRQSLMLA